MIDPAQKILEKLNSLHRANASQTIFSLFESDPNRFEHFSARCGDVLFDYSKNNVSSDALNFLLKLASAAGVNEKRKALFNGNPINTTENRPVQHLALRNMSGKPVMVCGEDVMKAVLTVRQQMEDFSTAVRNGSIRGKGGKFTHVVNIGIGGSDLGPAMANAALAPYQGTEIDALRVRFVSNVDGADIADVLENVPAATTLFIVASKSFTTQETMTNASTARDWLVRECGIDAVSDHFVALSTAIEKTKAFGIANNRVFGFWDWVGGRYSIWSAVGLSLMLNIGPENFRQFLEGAHSVDEHFLNAPERENIPLLMGLIGIYHRNVCGYETHGVMPYDQHMQRFPAYLQQLDMESNGKRVSIENRELNCESGPVVWGEPGTNGQHAFFQLLHQGTSIVPVDFLIAANANNPIGDHHEKLAANAFAQTEALMLGRTNEMAQNILLSKGMGKAQAAKLAPHKTFPGNRPTSTFLYPKLTPFVLGQLIALYEHKIFVQGAIWNINSFDQWGVELGKELAGELLPLVKGEVKDGTTGASRNGSTTGLLAAFHLMRK